MNPDSGTTELLAVHPLSPHQIIYSAPQESRWIQPNLSEVRGFPKRLRLINDIYAAPVEDEFIITELVVEFEAWETASDEALLSFESRLMNEEG